MEDDVEAPAEAATAGNPEPTEAAAAPPPPGEASPPASIDDAASGGVEALIASFGAGGPVLAILAVFSLVAATVLLAKALQFARAGLSGRAAEAARAAAERHRRGQSSGPPAKRPARHPAAELVALAETAFADGAAPDAARAELERIGQARLSALRSHFRLLELVAALAPLLGLFGTVLGMIEAFQALEQAGGSVDPATLSGGIWQALLTTAVGLAVAMPAAAALAWLERRVERTAEAMDDVLARLFAPPIDVAAPAADQRHAAE